MIDSERFQAGNPAQAQGGLNPEESFDELDQATSRRLGREAQATAQQGQAGARDFGMALEGEEATDLGEAGALTAGLAIEGQAARTGQRAREGQASRERGEAGPESKS